MHGEPFPPDPTVRAEKAHPRVIVLMGVSGSGKSTIGRRLSRTLGWPFRDADSFHPAANIEKMSKGLPLDDRDRGPWLEAIAAWIDAHRAGATHAIVSCSALKRHYREVVIGRRSDVRLVYLQGSFSLIADRLSRRKDHFMPPALLASQFETLEVPSPEEGALTIPVRLTPKRVVERIIRAYDLPVSEMIAERAD